jgi:O-antigen ligase
LEKAVNMASELSSPGTVFPEQRGGFGEKLRWLGILVAFGILGFIALGVVNPFDSALRIVLVLAAPVFLVFVLPGTVRTVLEGARSVAKHFTWYQGLWLLVLVSGLVFRVREFQDINEESIDGWALFRICVAGLVGLILLARLLSKKTKWLRWLFRGVIGILTVYVLVCLASTGWSVRPAWTFYKSLEYLVDLSVLSAVLVSVKSTQEYERFLNWTWILLGVMLVTAWAGALIDPTDALEAGHHFGPLGVRLEGLIPDISANSIGEFSAILAVVALCRLMYDPEKQFGRSWYQFLFLSSIVTLMLSQTRAAMAGLLASIFLLLILTRRFLLGAAVGIGSALVAIIVLAFTKFGSVFSAFLLRGQPLAEAEGLTGRIDFWQYAFQKFLERPWTGYGGFAGGRFVILPGLGRYEVPDVHSNLVESSVDIGIWGPILLVILLISMWWFLLKAFRDPSLRVGEHRFVIEALAIFGVITVRSLVSGNMLAHPAFGFLALVSCAEFMRRRVKFGERLGSEA